MGEQRPIACKTCRTSIKPTTIGRSDYARRLPMCLDCEETALREVRPSPQDRNQKGYKHR